MRYYKEKEVETKVVHKYLIAKIKCDECCYEFKKGEDYYDTYEYPDYPECEYNQFYFCPNCFHDYIESMGNGQHIEVTRKTFYGPFEVNCTNDFDYLDKDE